MRRIPTVLPPSSRRGAFRRGIVGSALAHVLVLGFLLWGASQVEAPPAFRTPGAPGPLGGGGGGHGDVRFIELPPLGQPQAAQQKAAAVPTEQHALPIPDPRVKVLPDSSPTIELRADLGAPVAVADLSEGQAGGGAGGPGAGPGTGGGVGSGSGTGRGNAVGPGTGGEGGDVYPPQPRQLVLPPPDPPGSVRGQEYTVTFWIDERGRVTRLVIDPTIPDAAYRRKFLERMQEMQFYPARDLDGKPLAAQLVMTIVPGG